MLPSLLLLTLLTCVAVTSPVDKRWYSVEAIDEHQIEGFFRPWSPVAGTDKHPLRYCFADARSQKNLGKIVDHAINKWKPAFEISLLDITPDNKKQLVCEDGKTRVDALVIRDATKDGDSDWTRGPECPTDSASTGYNYDPALKHSQRHRLDFCHLDPDDIKGTEVQAVRAMMHEFGHAIGLQHEHQRQDRDDYLDFRCENLIGYKEAKEKAQIDHLAHFDVDVEDEDRFRIMCDDDVIANDYLPAALPFVRGDEGGHRNELEKEQWESFVWSNKFDYDSIMIYNSNANTPDDADPKDPKTWVLARKDGKPVWQGGSQRAADAEISTGDIARVMALYPKGGAKLKSSDWAFVPRTKEKSAKGKGKAPVTEGS